MSRFVLDCAILRPIDDQARQWHAAAQERAWAAPAGGYHEAKMASALLQQAGSTLATLSGGKSAQFAPDIASAIDRAVSRLLARGDYRRVLTTAVDSLMLQQHSAAAAARAGVAHAVLAVDGTGRIDMTALREVAEPSLLVTHAANQEIGTVQADVSAWLAQSHSALILDGSCAFGWVPIPADWSVLILDPRAWGSPAGATVLIDGKTTTPTADFNNVPAAVTAGLTAERWLHSSSTAAQAAATAIRRIRTLIQQQVADVDIRGGGDDDLPHLLSISVLYVDAEALQTRLDARGFAVGSGSACASRSGQPSHVLAAIGGLTSGNVRLGLPPDLPQTAVQRFVADFIDVVDEVRAEVGAP